ncbi:unnamed protein product [Amoebophrya sp. A25]|nr:unnamed protein product [Amoebophrya sp. A25]|eukprot:GSA25T00014212001.1
MKKNDATAKNVMRTGAADENVAAESDGDDLFDELEAAVFGEGSNLFADGGRKRRQESPPLLGPKRQKNSSPTGETRAFVEADAPDASRSAKRPKRSPRPRHCCGPRESATPSGRGTPPSSGSRNGSTSMRSNSNKKPVILSGPRRPVSPTYLQNELRYTAFAFDVDEEPAVLLEELQNNLQTGRTSSSAHQSSERGASTAEDGVVNQIYFGHSSSSPDALHKQRGHDAASTAPYSMSLLDLPDLVQSRICEFIPWRCLLLRFSSVCRATHAMVMGTELFWFQAYRQYFYRTYQRQVLAGEFWGWNGQKIKAISTSVEEEPKKQDSKIISDRMDEIQRSCTKNMQNAGKNGPYGVEPQIPKELVNMKGRAPLGAVSQSATTSKVLVGPVGMGKSTLSIAAAQAKIASSLATQPGVGRLEVLRRAGAITSRRDGAYPCLPRLKETAAAIRNRASVSQGGLYGFSHGKTTPRATTSTVLLPDVVADTFPAEKPFFVDTSSTSNIKTASAAYRQQIFPFWYLYFRHKYLTEPVQKSAQTEDWRDFFALVNNLDQEDEGGENHNGFGGNGIGKGQGGRGIHRHQRDQGANVPLREEDLLDPEAIVADFQEKITWRQIGALKSRSGVADVQGTTSTPPSSSTRSTHQYHAPVPPPDVRAPATSSSSAGAAGEAARGSASSSSASTYSRIRATSAAPFGSSSLGTSSSSSRSSSASPFYGATMNKIAIAGGIPGHSSSFKKMTSPLAHEQRSRNLQYEATFPADSGFWCRGASSTSSRTSDKDNSYSLSGVVSTGSNIKVPHRWTQLYHSHWPRTARRKTCVLGCEICGFVHWCHEGDRCEFTLAVEEKFICAATGEVKAGRNFVESMMTAPSNVDQFQVDFQLGGGDEILLAGGAVTLCGPQRAAEGILDVAPLPGSSTHNSVRGVLVAGEMNVTVPAPFGSDAVLDSTTSSGQNNILLGLKISKSNGAPQEGPRSRGDDEADENPTGTSNTFSMRIAERRSQLRASSNRTGAQEDELVKRNLQLWEGADMDLEHDWARNIIDDEQID